MVQHPPPIAETLDRLRSDPSVIADSLRLAVKRNEASEHQFCKRKKVTAMLFAVDATGVLSPQKLEADNSGPAFAELCTGERGNCGCPHAELKLLMDALRSGMRGPFIMATNYSPCTSCAHAIIASGIVSAVAFFHTTKHDTRGIFLLIYFGIQTVMLPTEDDDPYRS